MAKQRLGPKKHRLCEQISGKPYRSCYTSGHLGHGVAECWFGVGDTVSDADIVFYTRKDWEPLIRNGQSVKPILRALFRSLSAV